MVAVQPHILVVEPGAPVQRLFAWGLQQEGLRVAVAPGDDAPPDLEETSPDVVVLNTMLAELQRRDIVSVMHSLVPRAGVIELVPKQEPQPRTGADVYVWSPYPLHTVVEEISSLISAARQQSATAEGMVREARAAHERSLETRALSARARDHSRELRKRSGEAHVRALELWARIREGKPLA